MKDRRKIIFGVSNLQLEELYFDLSNNFIPGFKPVVLSDREEVRSILNSNCNGIAAFLLEDDSLMNGLGLVKKMKVNNFGICPPITLLRYNPEVVQQEALNYGVFVVSSNSYVSVFNQVKETIAPEQLKGICPGCNDATYFSYKGTIAQEENKEIIPLHHYNCNSCKTTLIPSSVKELKN